MLFCSPQVLVMTTRTLCTQRTTLICLVQTTSRSSLIGPHISKHWCRSCVPNASSTSDHRLSCFFLLLSVCWADHWKRETREDERRQNTAQSVSRAVILSAEHAEMKILFQAKLYLCHHHLGSLWFSASNSLTWHQAHTTAHRENRSYFTSVQD